MEWPRAWHAEVATGSFTLSSKNLVSQNPFTRRLSVSGPINQLFMVKLQLTTQVYETWIEMEGFLAEAAGTAAIIRMADFGRLAPRWNKINRGTVSYWTDGGSPAVESTWSDGSGWVAGLLPPYLHVYEDAPKGATSIVIAGLEAFASTASVLFRGDDFEIRRNGQYDETPSLHRIIRPMNANANGRGRVEFRPGLRKGVMAGDQIVLSYPMGNFRLASDEQGVIERFAPDFGTASFELIEALI